MSLNVKLALLSALIWGGSYGWYFLGTSRIFEWVTQAARWVRRGFRAP